MRRNAEKNSFVSPAIPYVMAVRLRPIRVTDEALTPDERAFNAVRSGFCRTVVSVFAIREIRRSYKSERIFVWKDRSGRSSFCDVILTSAESGPWKTLYIYIQSYYSLIHPDLLF